MTSRNEANRTFATIAQYGDREKNFYEKLFQRFKDNGDKISANTVGTLFKKSGLQNGFLKDTWILLCVNCREIDLRQFMLFAKHCAVSQNNRPFDEISFQSEIPCLNFNDDSINALNTPVAQPEQQSSGNQNQDLQAEMLTSLPPDAFDYLGNIKPQYQKMVDQKIQQSQMQMGNKFSFQKQAEPKPAQQAPNNFTFGQSQPPQQQNQFSFNNNPGGGGGGLAQSYAPPNTNNAIGGGFGTGGQPAVGNQLFHSTVPNQTAGNNTYGTNTSTQPSMQNYAPPGNTSTGGFGFNHAPKKQETPQVVTAQHPVQQYTAPVVTQAPAQQLYTPPVVTPQAPAQQQYNPPVQQQRAAPVVVEKKIDFSNPNYIYRFNPIDKLAQYERKVKLIDTKVPGKISRKEAGPLMKKSGLTMKQLKSVWLLCAIKDKKSLTSRELCITFHLMDLAKAKVPVPVKIPDDLMKYITQGRYAPSYEVQVKKQATNLPVPDHQQLNKIESNELKDQFKALSNRYKEIQKENGDQIEEFRKKNTLNKGRIGKFSGGLESLVTVLRSLVPAVQKENKTLNDTLGAFRNMNSGRTETDKTKVLELVNNFSSSLGPSQRIISSMTSSITGLTTVVDDSKAAISKLENGYKVKLDQQSNLISELKKREASVVEEAKERIETLEKKVKQLENELLQKNLDIEEFKAKELEWNQKIIDAQVNKKVEEIVEEEETPKVETTEEKNEEEETIAQTTPETGNQPTSQVVEEDDFFGGDEEPEKKEEEADDFFGGEEEKKEETTEDNFFGEPEKEEEEVNDDFFGGDEEPEKKEEEADDFFGGDDEAETGQQPQQPQEPAPVVVETTTEVEEKNPLADDDDNFFGDDEEKTEEKKEEPKMEESKMEEPKMEEDDDFFGGDDDESPGFDKIGESIPPGNNQPVQAEEKKKEDDDSIDSDDDFLDKGNF